MAPNINDDPFRHRRSLILSSRLQLVFQ